MEAGSKIILDTCVIIAASINHSCNNIPKNIIDKFHYVSKSLIDHIKNNNLDLAYVLEISIIKARKKLSKIITRHLNRISLTYMIDKETFMKEHTFALIKINDSLNEHVIGVNVIPLGEDHLLEIKKKVNEFYKDVNGIILRYHPKNQIREQIRLAGRFGRFIKKRDIKNDYKKDFKIARILLEKFNSPEFDDEDITILSQARYFKKELNEEENKIAASENKIIKEREVYIASTDYHFCEVEVEGSLKCLVPDKIEERFHVKAWKPEKILKELLRK